MKKRLDSVCEPILAIRGAGYLRKSIDRLTYHTIFEYRKIVGIIAAISMPCSSLDGKPIPGKFGAQTIDGPEMMSVHSDRTGSKDIFQRVFHEQPVGRRKLISIEQQAVDPGIGFYVSLFAGHDDSVECIEKRKGAACGSELFRREIRDRIVSDTIATKRLENLHTAGDRSSDGLEPTPVIGAGSSA